MNHRVERWLVSVGLYGSTALVLIFFYVPIVTLMAFSLQEGRYLILPFEGVTLHWYGELFRHPTAGTALLNSTIIALVTTLFCTIIGTMAAIVWVRYRFAGERWFKVLTATPLVFPQLLLGIILLLWFSVVGRWLDFSTGLVTAIIGHTVYIAPFAMIIASVQVHGLDDTLEDAARDCGASTWQVYREVTLPLLWPGIFSAAIFAFLLSWGNFYLTYSLAGTARTLPTFVFSGIATGSSPLYPAMATVVFIPGLVLVAMAEHMRRRALRA